MSPLAIAGGLLLGVIVGVISATVGIGGGALFIPAMTMIYGMSQRKAQGTSIATLLAPIGIFAFWEYWKTGSVDGRLAILLAIGFAVGGFVGGHLAQHISDVILRRLFAVLLIAVALRMLLE